MSETQITNSPANYFFRRDGSTISRAPTTLNREKIRASAFVYGESVSATSFTIDCLK